VRNRPFLTRRWALETFGRIGRLRGTPGARASPRGSFSPGAVNLWGNDISGQSQAEAGATSGKSVKGEIEGPNHSRADLRETQWVASSSGKV
jgi:hypothetical protein